MGGRVGVCGQYSKINGDTLGHGGADWGELAIAASELC